MKMLAMCVLLAVAAGCRSVTVNQVPGGGPVSIYGINQSYAPDISLLSGLDTNTTKAIAQGAAMGLK